MIRIPFERLTIGIFSLTGSPKDGQCVGQIIIPRRLTRICRDSILKCIDRVFHSTLDVEAGAKVIMRVEISWL